MGILLNVLLHTLFIISNSQALVAPTFHESLSEAETNGAVNSEILKSISASVESSEYQAKSTTASTLPNLSLVGSYNYQTEVPSLGPITFGTHNNYAIGPVLTYTLFDKGKDKKLAESYKLQSLSKNANYTAVKKQIELSIRLVYFKTQYALKELDLVFNSLQIAKDQSNDIDQRFKAGSSSRLDVIQAKREVLSYQLKFKQAQTKLAGSLRELVAFIGVGKEFDMSRPIPKTMAQEGIESPSVLIDLDSIDHTLKNFSGLKFIGPTENHPELKVLNHQNESLIKAFESEKSSLWPKLQLLAKSQYIYPDIVLPKKVIQNTIGVTISIPLYEGEASESRAATKLSEANSSSYQKQQRFIDLTRDFFKGLDSLASLESQKKLSEKNVNEAKEVVRLTYQSYRAGKIRYLDVQDANLKFLEAQVYDAQIESSILVEKSNLHYLSTEEK